MNTLTRQEMQELAFEPQQPESDQLDLVRYWRAIGRNKWRILALVAAVGILAALYRLRPAAGLPLDGHHPGGGEQAEDRLHRGGLQLASAARSASTTRRSSRSSSRANSPSLVRAAAQARRAPGARPARCSRGVLRKWLPKGFLGGEGEAPAPTEEASSGG